MTSVWLISGGVLVAVLLLVSALLPRPSAEYRLIDLTPLGQSEKEASKFSPKKGAAGKGEGQPGDQPGDTEKDKGVDGKDKPRGSGGKDKDGKDKDGKDGQGSKDKDKGGQGEKDKDTQAKNAVKDANKQGSDEKNKTGGQKANEQDEIAQQMSETSSRLKEAVQQLKTLMKMLAFTVVGIIVIFALLNGGLRIWRTSPSGPAICSNGCGVCGFGCSAARKRRKKSGKRDVPPQSAWWKKPGPSRGIAIPGLRQRGPADLAGIAPLHLRRASGVGSGPRRYGRGR